MVIALAGIVNGSYELSDTEADQKQETLVGQYGRTDFDNYVATLKANADIERKKKKAKASY